MVQVGVATTDRLVHAIRPGRPAPARTRTSEAAHRYLESLEQAHRHRLDQELNRTHYRPIEPEAPGAGADGPTHDDKEENQ